jgi:ABC-type uncharacterized transport system ATPase subunit
MLTTLHLHNFRGFADHAVSFRPLSVIVGPNNGGKSTVIEALRLVAEAIDRIPHGRFAPAPEKFQRLGVTEPGVFITPEQLGVRPATLFHRYTPPPARITATFSSGTTLSLWMPGHDALLAVLSDHHGRTVSARSELRNAQLPQVRVLPQIRPLEEQETTLKGQYVLQCLNSHLASRHFRNQLRFLHEHFPAFVRLFQSSWSNVRISAFDAPNSNHGDSLALMINEDGFVAEAADFGHGMQMWLQITWFLARVAPNAVVVLDEPDVYINPQQQASLTRLLQDRTAQAILTTHSPTIIDQCSPGEILRIHRSTALSRTGTSAAEHEQQIQVATEQLRQAVLKAKSDHSMADPAIPTAAASPVRLIGARKQQSGHQHQHRQRHRRLRVSATSSLRGSRTRAAAPAALRSKHATGSTLALHVTIREYATFLATDQYGGILLDISGNGTREGIRRMVFIPNAPFNITATDSQHIKCTLDGKQLQLTPPHGGGVLSLEVNPQRS